MHTGNYFKKVEKWNALKMRSLSALHLFNADVSESSSFISVSLIMAHGFWANAMTPGRGEKEQKCSGMRSGLEDIVERMTKKGKMRLGRGVQERLRVQRQTVREEVSQ